MTHNPSGTSKQADTIERITIAGFALVWVAAWLYFIHAFTYAYCNANASSESLKTAKVKVDKVKTITRDKATSSSRNYYFTVASPAELAGREFHVPGDAEGSYTVGSLSGQEVTIQYAPYNGFGIFDSTVYSIKDETNESLTIGAVKKAEAEANPLWINGALFAGFLYAHFSVWKSERPSKKKSAG
jgi:hypothetical protein